MTNACDLRIDFLGWTANRLGVSREVVQAVGKVDAAAATARANYGHTKQEQRRHGSQESYQRRPRQKRLVFA